MSIQVDVGLQKKHLINGFSTSKAKYLIIYFYKPFLTYLYYLQSETKYYQHTENILNALKLFKVESRYLCLHRKVNQQGILF